MIHGLDYIIVRSYVDTGALDRHCPQCDAETAQWCNTPDSRDRRVPCIARFAITEPKGQS